ncbi:MAG: 8-oxo-dGTP pyrophosphatase MutT (NUDIX family) [Algoriphagus sp.]|jgi:8-oxo-dGTP pyrophosphatase MutT (NUDIX family)
MVLFINDRPIHFLQDFNGEESHYDTMIHDFDKQRNIKDWKKNVLFPEATAAIVSEFLKATNEVKSFDFKSLTFAVANLELTKNAINRLYTFIDAAGGVILNEEKKILMIYRLNKWDLPKGKMEGRETIKETAIREVEEECCVTVKCLDECFVTYHTYSHKKRRILKRTYWYKMELISDEKMTPQVEEGIQDIRWMNREEMYVALKNSYASIKYVLNNTISQELNFSKG